MLRCIFTLFVCTLSAVAIAGEEVEKSFETNAKGVVVLDFMRGDVSVKGWEQTQIKIKGELDDSQSHLDVENKGTKTIIRLQIEGRRHKGDSSDIQVYIPTSKVVKFSGVKTDYRIENVHSGVFGKTMSGDIELKNVRGKMALHSVSGSIELSEVEGKAKLETVSGNMSVSGMLTNTYAKSMSGDLEIDLSHIKQLKLKNVSGKTHVKGELSENAKVSISSVSGDIEYISVGKLNAQCDLISQFGGDIVNEMTDDKATKSRIKKSLSFVSGDGSGKLSLKTLSGEINIRNADG